MVLTYYIWWHPERFCISTELRLSLFALLCCVSLIFFNLSFQRNCLKNICLIHQSDSNPLQITIFFPILGTALLPVVAFPFEDIYIDRRHILHTLTKREQKIIFYFALLTASLGIGGIRAIVCPLSAYNLEDCGPKELLSFFNWLVT